jgi:hypothetical protein
VIALAAKDRAREKDPLPGLAGGPHDLFERVVGMRSLLGRVAFQALKERGGNVNEASKHREEKEREEKRKLRVEPGRTAPSRSARK